MSFDLEYVTALTSEDAQHLNYILDQSFVGFPASSEAYMSRIGRAHFRAVRHAQTTAGGLALIPMGQWWGEKRVPMTGIAAVGVAPEFRGTGTAITLLRHMLIELHELEVPISVLYPATQQLYRKAGYEAAGLYYKWTIATQEIQLKERLLPIQPLPLDNVTPFQTLHQQWATLNNGNLDRNPAIWQDILTAWNQTPVYAYQVGTPDPQGYIVFTQESINGKATILIKDWVALTAEVGRSIWSFLADHRSQIDQVEWKGGAIDPLTLLLPEQTFALKTSDRWMLRIVDVASALQKRGYPTHVQAEIHLHIHDDLLPNNNGKFILSVANQQGSVTPGGNGDLEVDIRGLAPLYTGLFSPQQLHQMGYVTATKEALASATQIFATTTPWMADFF